MDDLVDQWEPEAAEEVAAGFALHRHGDEIEGRDVVEVESLDNRMKLSIRVGAVVARKQRDPVG